MKNCFKLLAAFVCMTVLLSSVVCNAEVINTVTETEITNGKEVNVSGVIPLENRNSDADYEVSIEVFKENSDLTIPNSFTYLWQTTADKSTGEYNFKFKIDSDTGNYVVRIGYVAVSENDKRSKIYIYIDTDDLIWVLKTSNEGINEKDSAKLKSAVSFLSSYGIISPTKVTGLADNNVYTYMSNINGSYTDISQMTDEFERCLVIDRVEKSDVSALENLTEFEGFFDRLDICESLKTSYEIMTAQEKKKLAEYIAALDMNDESSDSSASFAETFKKRMTVMNIADAMWQQAKSFIAANRKYLNITDAVYEKYENLENPDDVIKALTQTVNETNIDRVGSLFEEAVNEQEKEKEEEKGSTPIKGNSSSGGSSYSVNHVPASSVQPDATPTLPVEKKAYFSDMKDAAWAEETVNALYEKGIIKGREDNKFFPNDDISREEFVTLAVNAFSLKYSDSACNFKDMSESDWYYYNVIAAVENKLITGIDETHFGSGQPIKRCDMAVIMHRLMQEKKVETSDIIVKTFSDISESSYAFSAVNAMYNSGIMDGTGGNLFEPEKNATRAQAAKVIYELMKLL